VAHSYTAGAKNSASQFQLAFGNQALRKMLKQELGIIVMTDNDYYNTKN
jgi:hypothetical protein